MTEGAGGGTFGLQSTDKEDSMHRLARFTPLTGLISALLVIVSTIVGPTGPDAKSNGAQVIAFYSAHRSGERAAAVLGTLAVVFFIFFAGSLYNRIRETDSRALGVVGLVGAGLLAAGLTVSGSITWALTDGPAHYSAASAQALNALAFDTFLPIVAGLIVFAIATGIAVIREGWLPAWLGWVLVALGVITPSPALPVGLFGVIAWSAVVAVILFAGTPAERQRGARVSNAAA